MLRLTHYNWPGNVRELANVIERAVVICRSEQIGVDDLLPLIAVAGDDDFPHVPGASLAAVERHVILKTLESTGGPTDVAAQILGVSRRTLQYRVREYEAENCQPQPAVAGQ